jgi:hypothetical protein
LAANSREEFTIFVERGLGGREINFLGPQKTFLEKENICWNELVSRLSTVVVHLLPHYAMVWAGNTKGKSITAPLTSCLTGLD